MLFFKALKGSRLCFPLLPCWVEGFSHVMMIEKRRETAVRGFSKTRTTCSHPHFVSRTHTVKITPKQVELTHTHTCGAVTSACLSEFGMRIICGQRAAELQASTLRSVHSMVTLPKRFPSVPVVHTVSRQKKKPWWVDVCVCTAVHIHVWKLLRLGGNRSSLFFHFSLLCSLFLSLHNIKLVKKNISMAYIYKYIQYIYINKYIYLFYYNF